MLRFHQLHWLRGLQVWKGKCRQPAADLLLGQQRPLQPGWGGTQRCAGEERTLSLNNRSAGTRYSTRLHSLMSEQQRQQRGWCRRPGKLSTATAAVRTLRCQRCDVCSVTSRSWNSVAGLVTDWSSRKFVSEQKHKWKSNFRPPGPSRVSQSVFVFR